MYQLYNFVMVIDADPANALVTAMAFAKVREAPLALLASDKLTSPIPI